MGKARSPSSSSYESAAAIPQKARIRSPTRGHQSTTEPATTSASGKTSLKPRSRSRSIQRMRPSHLRAKAHGDRVRQQRARSSATHAVTESHTQDKKPPPQAPAETSRAAPNEIQDTKLDLSTTVKSDDWYTKPLSCKYCGAFCIPVDRCKVNKGSKCLPNALDYYIKPRGPLHDSKGSPNDNEEVSISRSDLVWLAVLAFVRPQTTKNVRD